MRPVIIRIGQQSDEWRRKLKRSDTDLSSLSTEYIIEACLEGDREAFQILVGRYQGFVYSLAIRYLANDEDARDVVQETFFRVWQHLKRFNRLNKFTTWLYRIVINLCLDLIRSRRRKSHPQLDPNETKDGQIAYQPGYEAESIRKDLARRIIDWAQDLTDRQRTVFILRDLEGLDMEEVAEITGISRAAVKSNLCHARKNIRKRIIHSEKYGGSS